MASEASEVQNVGLQFEKASSQSHGENQCLFTFPERFAEKSRNSKKLVKWQRSNFHWIFWILIDPKCLLDQLQDKFGQIGHFETKMDDIFYLSALNLSSEMDLGLNYSHLDCVYQSSKFSKCPFPDYIRFRLI